MASLGARGLGGARHETRVPVHPFWGQQGRPKPAGHLASVFAARGVCREAGAPPCPPPKSHRVLRDQCPHGDPSGPRPANPGRLATAVLVPETVDFPCGLRSQALRGWLPSLLAPPPRCKRGGCGASRNGGQGPGKDVAAQSQPHGLSFPKQAERTGERDPGVWVLSLPKADGSSASTQGPGGPPPPLTPAAGRGRPGLAMTRPEADLSSPAGTWGCVGGGSQRGTSTTGRGKPS